MCDGRGIDYRLSNEVSDTSDHALNNNNLSETPRFLMQSVIGCYQEESIQENGEYFEGLKNIPGLSPSNKTKIKDDVKTGTLQSNVRSNMFRDMESSEDSQHDHLSILTAHLTLSTDTFGETDDG